MPSGFGFNWPGHSSAAAEALLAKIPIHAGATGLATATEDAVRTLAASAGVTLGGHASASAGAAAVTSSIAPLGQAAQPRVLSSAHASSGQSADSRAGIIAIVLVLLAGAGVGGRTFVRRRRMASVAGISGPRLSGPGGPVNRITVLAAGGTVIGLGLIVALLVTGNASPSRTPTALARNPDVDPGQPLTGQAPRFTLYDESGSPVSLGAYRGKVVILGFTDSVCTTICPMTTTAMLDAKAMLGRAGAHVQLLGVDANPAATSLEDVASYTRLHGLLGRWHFLTGSVPQLKRVWHAYHIAADIEHGLIDHTPALFVIGPQGQAARVYITQQSYAAIGQLGQVVAHEAARLLPGHPPVDSHLSYSTISGIGPAATVSLPRAGGGRVILGPGRTAHLGIFFATWDQEITSLAGHLGTLNGYASTARRAGLPPLTAVDEGSVEPSPTALTSFLHGLRTPLVYPVAIDATGRVADGYEVDGQPWFVLTSASGQILWHQEVDTQGWPTDIQLVNDIKAALAKAPAGQTSLAAVKRELVGSPAPLGALHAQASELLGDNAQLMARIHALRGYPIVINAWESYCQPCQAEYRLFARASATYGRRVAFLGADANDSAGDGRTFLAGHPVSYPSYQVTTAQLSPLAAIEGYPTTIFINSTGKVVHVQDGQYDAQGTLDQDIATYAH
jgi:cytochrome c biogenesis protein CcmG/thiol:disulfide interchange protein DsbE